MTAHGGVETAVEALRAGATDYLLKPVVFDDLLAKVAHLLEYRQLVSSSRCARAAISPSRSGSICSTSSAPAGR